MKALVTGGGGFLGGALARLLVRAGHEVTSFSRAPYPELQRDGIRHVTGDLCDASAVELAVRGHDTVFHVAAMAGVWGAPQAFRRANVDGTVHVLDACRRQGILRLVYTSSPSVCFDGHSHTNAGNDLPYAARYACPYPATKAAAERLVLAAHGQDGLATCALRPHLIFGPGDPHLVPRLLERARRGRLAIIGDGQNEVSLTYIDNAAAAHLDAALALAPDAAHGGRAYFISQAEPVRLWDWVAELLERTDHPPLKRRVPLAVAAGAGGVLELGWRLLRLSGEPPMTRFVARQLATSHSYDLGPAQRDFGYHERVSLREGTERVVAWARERTAVPN